MSSYLRAKHTFLSSNCFEIQKLNGKSTAVVSINHSFIHSFNDRNKANSQTTIEHDSNFKFFGLMLYTHYSEGIMGHPSLCTKKKWPRFSIYHRRDNRFLFSFQFRQSFFPRAIS